MAKEDKKTNLELIAYKLDRLEKNFESEMKEIKDGFKSLAESADKKFVTTIEFGPVKNVVYGLVGLILMAVIGAVVALVIKQ